MSILDKLMDTMHLNTEDDYDDYDDFDDDYEDERSKKGGLFKKKDKDYDYDLADDVVADKPAKKQAPARITPMRSKKGSNGMEVCVFKPTQFDESREITDTLLSNCTVDVEIAQRIIDFTSGSCYAIGGNLRKVSNYIFIVTPRNVDLAGDFQEIVAGAFDVPSI